MFINLGITNWCTVSHNENLSKKQVKKSINKKYSNKLFNLITLLER